MSSGFGDKSKVPMSPARIKNATGWFLIAVIGATVSACSPAATVTLVTDPPQRIQLNGFSVQPPAGTNWYRVTASSNPEAPLLFHKMQGDMAAQRAKGHTFLAVAQLQHLGEKRFANATELAKELAHLDRQWVPHGSRFKLLDAKYTADNTLGPPICVRSNIMQEDRGVPGWSGSVFIIDSHGFFCVHPHSPGHLVHIHYSERRLKDDPSWALEKEVEPFLRSLVFTHLRQ